MTFLPLACLTCAKAFEHAGDNAAGYAILLMLVILVGILGCIGLFMFKMARKSQAALDPKYADPFHDTLS